MRKKPAHPPTPTRQRMNHAACVLLTLFCVILAQVLFRAESTPDAFAIFAAMAGKGGLGAHMLAPLVKPLVLLPLLFVAVWLLPNTQQILARFESDPATVPQSGALGHWLLWRPNLAWALSIAGTLLICLAYLEDTSRFLYFQF